MAGMEEPLAVSESLNALANGHDKVSPFPKRRRKSGGNDADADAQPQGDALDGSGRSRPEANKGVLETQGRDGTPLKGAGPEGVCWCLWVFKSCGRLAVIAPPDILVYTYV